jgi:hypothetical protein
MWDHIRLSMTAPKAAIALSENYLRSKNSIESCTVPVRLFVHSIHKRNHFASLGRSCLPGSCCNVAVLREVAIRVGLICDMDSTY